MNSVRKMSLVTLIVFIAAMTSLFCTFLNADDFGVLMRGLGLDNVAEAFFFIQNSAGLCIVLAEFALFTVWLCAEKSSPMVFVPLIGLMVTTGVSMLSRIVGLITVVISVQLPMWYWDAYSIVWIVTMVMACAALIWLGIKMLPRSKFLGVMLFVAASEVLFEVVFAVVRSHIGSLSVLEVMSILQNAYYWMVWGVLYLSIILGYRTSQECEAVS